MSDRRRRRLEDEGEDETADTSVETETSSSSREGKVRVSECESEADTADVELSECDSESAAGEGGDQEEETEEGSESETEEGSETEEASESETETDGGEDYTDEEGLDGERQSGDGEEQPDDDKPDDDEDRKNPAYVPRKGAFYEHDFRDGLEGEEDVQEEAPIETKAKKKLWQDEGKWAHDFYRDDLQAPKTSEELIAIYGYDIRASDKPPEVSPRKPRRRGGGGGPRRENKFRDYLPRMAVIDTTEYGNDIVPNIDEDGLITYKDSAPKNNSRPHNSSRRGGRGGKFQRNNNEEDIGRGNNRQNHRRDDRNFPQSYSEQSSEEYPTLQESSRGRPFQEDSGRGRKATQPDNRYRETNQDNRYNDAPQDNRYRETHQDNRYRPSPENRYRDSPENRYRDSPENRYRDSYKKENRYRDSNQDNRYHESHQYGNEERSNNYSQNENRRGGFRGGNRGRGSSNYRQSQDIRQQEARMNEDNWNQRDSYENNRRDGRYNNSRNEERKIIITGDQNSSRSQMTRDDRNKNVRPQDRGYNNKQPSYQGGGGDGDHALPRRSGHDDYNNTSKRNNYRGYEQPPRYQQHQTSREMREFTNTSYKGDDGLGGRNVQKPAPNSYGSGIGPGETGDSKNEVLPGKDLPLANVNTSSSNVEKKSYAKERRAKGTQRVGDPVIKDRPTGVPNSLDSATGTGPAQQYINATPGVSTETASSQVAGGSKRYSSQRQQGLSKGSYTEPPPVDRGANLYNPALPPPSFYQRDPATSGQQPSSSSPAGVPDAPHFNPSILPPGTTALPYHLPAVPRPGLQMAGAAAPPAVFRPAQGPPPATAIAQAGPALIAPPYIPPGMIYGAATAPPRVPPPGTPAGLSLPFAYTAPPPPSNPLTGTAPTVSQADQMALASGQQAQQPANQPKKVYRGDIIYYAPELQQPSRTPQKRPKSAIPIVDPQEMRRLKELDAAREESMQETRGSSKPTHSVSKPVTPAEGHSHSHQRRVGPVDDPASQPPKPQRSSRERVVKEHTSGAPEMDQTAGVASRTQIDQGSLSNQQTADMSLRNSSTKAVKDSSSLENNHVNSSSPLPVAVESIKNEVLEVSKDLASLEISNLPNRSKSGGGSTSSAVSDVQGDSVETSSGNRKVAETDVVVKSEEAAA